MFETKRVLAFRDVNPMAPIHVLVVPKKHIESIDKIKDDDAGIIMEIIEVVNEVAKKEEIMQSGYRVIVNTGPDAGEIPHLHWHVIGGRKLKWEF